MTSRWRLWRDPVALAVLALLALFLFVDLRPDPIELWDESRIAVNALEMHLRGFSLVTTYEFRPDLWNTKPPLLIWLIDLAMAALGPSEWAVRLPSAIAAMATLAMVFALTRRATRSTWAGALAAALLALSVGFFGEHGARTGDFDALLCCLTTGYLSLLFFEAHRRRPRPGRLLAAAALVAAAGLTKSIAGLVPGVGLVVYLLVVGRWRRPLQSPSYPLAAVVALGPIVAFYAAREVAASGYLAAVWGNDVAYRFATALDQHAGPPWYYLAVSFWTGLFSAGAAALLAPLALLRARGLARQVLLFSLCVAAGFLAAISLSATKLPQYGLPAYPFMAVACGVAAKTAADWVSGLGPGRARALLARAMVAGLAAVLAFAAATAASTRLNWFPRRAYTHQGGYRDLLADLAARGVHAVTVVDGGVPAVGVPPGYSPQLRFYALIWAGRGLSVVHRLPGEPRAGLAVSCDPGLVGGQDHPPPTCAVLRP